MDREKVDLTGAPETMLATLYGRALDSRAAKSILHDSAAADAVARIEYDFRKTGVNAATAAGIAMRAKHLDNWTSGFLQENPTATVLHLACGLDTRAHRLAPGDGVRWIDVDYPDVVALRQRLLPTPSGDYRVVASSVTDAAWLEEVPADRPTVVVFEGLTMYLTGQEVQSLVERVVGRFARGELLFDVYGTTGIRLQKLVPAVRNAGATLRWGLDDPHAIERWGVRLVEDLRSLDLPEIADLPAASRIPLRVMAKLPGFRDVGRILRYRFPALSQPEQN
ncbi:class I SAM-dependent methyltransferase [Actinosynnema sp. NPDC047251]|uniref:O-methyltransferase family protein n=1 Tax=Saccharothrix espanaensis (strain ATCC 51144 / DSM 44229 / JCM 9112 / NBRC 15066 / NRRL 15764) TaxID=1179773 RepID=K0JNU4_SACES|nr:class I SAM-dependent methyltransferase [Saccharothrix espanaensis]CCH27790.1 O-methyltransferase family protein [Saccharothrix espanaensis DSM 44229]